MILILNNGEVVKKDSQDVLIFPLNDNFSIKKPDTWESDRAWTAQVGQTIWTGKDNNTAKITGIH